MDALRAITIDNTLRNHPCTKNTYQGIYPCDRLSEQTIQNVPCALVINFDPHDKPGSHWISLWFDKNKNVDYFDTYSRPLSVNPDIFDFVHKNGKSVNYLSGDAIQSDDSSVCGHYCILFTICKSNKIRFSDFKNTFTDQMYSGLFDPFVKRIINKIIKKYSSSKCLKVNKKCKCNPEQTCVSKEQCLTQEEVQKNGRL